MGENNTAGLLKQSIWTSTLSCVTDTESLIQIVHSFVIKQVNFSYINLTFSFIFHYFFCCGCCPISMFPKFKEENTHAHHCYLTIIYYSRKVSLNECLLRGFKQISFLNTTVCSPAGYFTKIRSHI